MKKIDNLLEQFQSLEALYKLAGYSDEQIFITAHHLVSDGVSKEDCMRVHTFVSIREWLVKDLKEELDNLAISEEEADIQQLCLFLVKNQVVAGAIFRHFMRMMANPIYAVSGYNEEVLASKAVEDKLLCPAMLTGKEEIEQLLKIIMINKVRYSCSISYSWNYRIFFDWFPKFWEIYPEVKQAIAKGLVAMKEKGILSLDVWEESRLYALYVK